MAEIALLHYQPGHSRLHRLDPRFKVVLMIGYIAGMFTGAWLHWGVTTALLFWASAQSGLRPYTFRRELKVFAVLALIIGASHFFIAAAAGWQAAAGAAAAAAWRFLLIVWLGILFTAVTDPTELHGVIYWLLKPVPGIPAGRLATHAALSLVIIPLLLDGVHEIREARKARGIELRKNPIIRMKSIMNPLMEKLLLQMEELALALEARYFDETVLHTRLRLRGADIFYTLFCLLPLLLLQIIHIYF
jgi:energy-coupling factor transporter transmembrane protein EcfT